MGLWPTHRDESALLRFIDSKQVTRNFQGSTSAIRSALGSDGFGSCKGSTRIACSWSRITSIK
jgi:hypothetical protein